MSLQDSFDPSAMEQAFAATKACYPQFPYPMVDVSPMMGSSTSGPMPSCGSTWAMNVVVPDCRGPSQVGLSTFVPPPQSPNKNAAALQICSQPPTLLSPAIGQISPVCGSPVEAYAPSQTSAIDFSAQAGHSPVSSSGGFWAQPVDQTNMPQSHPASPFTEEHTETTPRRLSNPKVPSSGVKSRISKQQKSTRRRVSGNRQPRRRSRNQSAPSTALNVGDEESLEDSYSSAPQEPQLTYQGSTTSANDRLTLSERANQEQRDLLAIRMDLQGRLGRNMWRDIRARYAELHGECGIPCLQMKLRRALIAYQKWPEREIEALLAVFEEDERNRSKRILAALKERINLSYPYNADHVKAQLVSLGLISGNKTTIEEGPSLDDDPLTPEEWDLLNQELEEAQNSPSFRMPNYGAPDLGESYVITPVSPTFHPLLPDASQFSAPFGFPIDPTQQYGMF